MSDQTAPDPEASPPPEQSPPATQPPPAGPGVAPAKTYVWGTGRRKKAVARVRIRPGTGKFLINKRDVDEYFKSERDREAVLSPLETVKMTRRFDVWANVGGGGSTGQADAIKLGLARALAKAAPEITPALREHRLMTRDARIKERKKYGRRGARRGLQWAKR